MVAPPGRRMTRSDRTRHRRSPQVKTTFRLGELFVDNVDAETVPGALHLGNEVPELLDPLHLLPEEVGLQEVAEVSVPLVPGRSVQG